MMKVPMFVEMFELIVEGLSFCSVAFAREIVEVFFCYVAFELLEDLDLRQSALESAGLALHEFRQVVSDFLISVEAETMLGEGKAIFELSKKFGIARDTDFLYADADQRVRQ
jgi:hypothetical protein